MAIDLVRRKCPLIPVPEVYGTWTTYFDRTEIGHIAMSYMPGIMLRDAWPSLTIKSQEEVLRQLQNILHQLRRIPVPESAMIGAVNGCGGAADSRGSSTELGGPFRTEIEFKEWLLSRCYPSPVEYYSSFFVDTLRTCLQTNTTKHTLRFTHQDLGMHNILVKEDRITAIIDWEYAGCYLEHWEYIKMIQFSRDAKFRCWARQCWEDHNGSPVFCDEESAADQLLDSQIRNGERVIKRPR